MTDSASETMQDIVPVQPSISESSLERIKTESTSFIPRLELVHAMSKSATDHHHEPGTFVLKNKNLGRKLRVLVCGHRDHALWLKDNSKFKESFKESSPPYQEMIRLAKLHTKQESKILWGLEWLFYIAEEGDFCVFHCGSNSNRTLSVDIADHITPEELRKIATNKLHTFLFEFTSEFVLFGKSKKSWVPKIQALPMDQQYIPNKDEAEIFGEMFYAPVKAEAEFVASEGPAR